MKGAQIAYQTKVMGIEKVADGYKVTVEDGTGELSFTTRLLINCAGLRCDKVAELAGIRPKLQEPGGDIKDFAIGDESDNGLPGFINLIGIEPPGLSASPAIAKYVWGLIEDHITK